MRPRTSEGWNPRGRPPDSARAASCPMPGWVAWPWPAAGQPESASASTTVPPTRHGGPRSRVLEPTALRPGACSQRRPRAGERVAARRASRAGPVGPGWRPRPRPPNATQPVAGGLDRGLRQPAPCRRYEPAAVAVAVAPGAAGEKTPGPGRPRPEQTRPPKAQSQGFRPTTVDACSDRATRHKTGTLQRLVESARHNKDRASQLSDLSSEYGNVARAAQAQIWDGCAAGVARVSGGPARVLGASRVSCPLRLPRNGVVPLVCRRRRAIAPA